MPMVCWKKTRYGHIPRGIIRILYPKAITPNKQMLSINDVSSWMTSALQITGCLYQQDVVDYLVRSGNELHLKENADGNQVLSTKIITKFRIDSGKNVVWVKPERYWRYRVPEDEDSREARG
ncbi:DUF6953 family protein [Leminorella richardii]|uniref:DUF6953 family protein n=2 Tax=Leminorella richardii TaxID=158841 RepID=UPI003BB12BCB